MMHIEFGEFKSGWGALQIASDEIEWMIELSNVGDPISQLSHSVRLSRLGLSSQVEFLLEPGVQRLRFEVEGGSLRLELAELREHGHAIVLGSLQTTVAKFDAAFRRAIAQIERNIGKERFHEQWGHPLPDHAKERHQ